VNRRYYERLWRVYDDQYPQGRWRSRNLAYKADLSTTASWYVHFNRKAGREAAQVPSNWWEGWESNPAISSGIVGVTAGVNNGQQEAPVVSC